MGAYEIAELFAYRLLEPDRSDQETLVAADVGSVHWQFARMWTQEMIENIENEAAIAEIDNVRHFESPISDLARVLIRILPVLRFIANHETDPRSIEEGHLGTAVEVAASLTRGRCQRGVHW